MPWSFLAWHHEKLHEIADGPIYLPEHILLVLLVINRHPDMEK